MKPKVDLIIFFIMCHFEKAENITLIQMQSQHVPKLYLAYKLGKQDVKSGSSGGNTQNYQY